MLANTLDEGRQDATSTLFSRIAPSGTVSRVYGELTYKIFYCPFYNELRDVLFSGVGAGVDMLNMDDSKRLNWLFENETYRLAKYLDKAWSLRKRAMYQ